VQIVVTAVGYIKLDHLSRKMHNKVSVMTYTI